MFSTCSLPPDYVFADPLRGLGHRAEFVLGVPLSRGPAAGLDVPHLVLVHVGRPVAVEAHHLAGVVEGDGSLANEVGRSVDEGVGVFVLCGAGDREDGLLVEAGTDEFPPEESYPLSGTKTQFDVAATSPLLLRLVVFDVVGLPLPCLLDPLLCLLPFPDGGVLLALRRLALQDGGGLLLLRRLRELREQCSLGAFPKLCERAAAFP